MLNQLPFHSSSNVTSLSSIFALRPASYHAPNVWIQWHHHQSTLPLRPVSYTLLTCIRAPSTHGQISLPSLFCSKPACCEIASSCFRPCYPQILRHYLGQGNPACTLRACAQKKGFQLIACSKIYRAQEHDEAIDYLPTQIPSFCLSPALFAREFSSLPESA